MNLASSEGFWAFLDKLVTSHEVVIDRPAGTAHPRYPNFVYPLDYGYLQGVSSSDGNDMDVWRGTGREYRVTGVACVSDDTKGDIELKVLLACTVADMETVYLEQNKAGMHALIVRR
jgi:inorganic pyrophosphatase